MLRSQCCSAYVFVFFVFFFVIFALVLVLVFVFVLVFSASLEPGSRVKGVYISSFLHTTSPGFS